MNDRYNKVQEVIVTADVRKLVQQDGFHLRSESKVVHSRHRQQDHRLQVTYRYRRRNQRRNTTFTFFFMPSRKETFCTNSRYSSCAFCCPSFLSLHKLPVAEQPHCRKYQQQHR
jgi:hypothetical protein